MPREDSQWKNYIDDISLKKLFEEFMDGYIFYDPTRTQEEIKKKEDPMKFLLKDRSPVIIKKILNIDDKQYQVKGTIGSSQLPIFPWIGIRNKACASNFMSGVYVVYLLSEDRKRLYLTLNQGSNELNKSGYEIELDDKEVLVNRAKSIRNKLYTDKFSSNISEVHLGNINEKGKKKAQAIAYEKGTIYFKGYSRDNLPSDEILATDLKDMFDLYNDYYHQIYKKENMLKKDDTLENVSYSRNRIIYGAPGTGKSYKIEQERKEYLRSHPQNYERVTFHPDYAYANFVGTYKPVPDFDEDGKKTISYKFVPGPFTRIYAKAIAHPEEQFLLLIEEINRAMVAAVFGDVFQLLDRKSTGESEYPITTSEDLRHYLAEVLDKDMADFETISLPSNLYIWATMNSADQGVFPMDTAFKRRWEFEYIDINASEEEIAKYNVDIPSENGPVSINWNALRKALNKKMIDCGINEDKLLGPFFLSPKSFVREDGAVDSQKFQTVFKNKVIMYLFEDAAKQHRGKIFGGAINILLAKTYSEICKKFDEKGLDIFPNEIKTALVQQTN